MGFRITSIIRRASFSRTQGSTKGFEVPKGYLAVYVGDKMRRFVIPISYLNQSLFQEGWRKSSKQITGWTVGEEVLPYSGDGGNESERSELEKKMNHVHGEEGGDGDEQFRDLEI